MRVSRALEDMPGELTVALEPILKTIEELTVRIRQYDALIESMGELKQGTVKQVSVTTDLLTSLLIRDEAPARHPAKLRALVRPLSAPMVAELLTG